METLGENVLGKQRMLNLKTGIPVYIYIYCIHETRVQYVYRYTYTRIHIYIPTVYKDIFIGGAVLKKNSI